MASRRSASASRRFKVATSYGWAKGSARPWIDSNAISRLASKSARSISNPKRSPRRPATSCSILVKAVSIVIVVLLFAMGRKTGLIIGLVLFLTIMATFLVMFMEGSLLMERISLGALIIALCMLTDNAIIMIEGVKVRIEAGDDKMEVVRDVVAQNQWPLFGATAIGVIAFAAIGLSEDRTGRVHQFACSG